MKKELEKLIKIGKWTLGVGAVLNIMVWAILGMLSYKYIYLDHFDSKYKKHIDRDTYYNDYHIYGMLKSLDELHTVYYLNLLKDEIKDLQGNRCDNFALEDINSFVTDTVKTVKDNFNFETQKKIEDNFLGYELLKGNFKDEFNCRNVKFAIFRNGLKYDEIGRIRIDIDDLEFNEYLDNNLHRLNERYKILDERDSERIYIDVHNKTYITINKNGSIDIIYPSYIERFLKIADRFYGSREEALEHPLLSIKERERYSGFNFFAFLLEETKKVPNNAKGILTQRHEEIIRENNKNFITDEMNKRLDFMGIKHD